MDSDVLTYGKIRGGWAKVGHGIGPEDILVSYRLSSNPYSNPITGVKIPLLFTPSTLISSGIKPSFNKEIQIGFDLGFYGGRIQLHATYHNKVHKNDIVPVDVSTATGYASYLTNAGKTQGDIYEFTLSVVPVQTANFRWQSKVNFSHMSIVVKELPAGLDTYTVSGTTSAFSFVNITHELGKELGQIYGAAIARNDKGQPILTESGLYTADTNTGFGSYQPDFFGGWVNSFRYKNISLQAVITYQKGGRFFSLSDMWGNYTGLRAVTAGLNDKGNPKRDPVSKGGGVHVQGVSAVDGSPIDMYVNASKYYHQWYANQLAGPFVYSKSYVKLKQVSLSYTLPQQWWDGVLNSVRISFIGRNLLMLYLPEENHSDWDPSELAHPWGENGQLPGTMSLGFNVHITF